MLRTSHAQKSQVMSRTRIASHDIERLAALAEASFARFGELSLKDRAQIRDAAGLADSAAANTELVAEGEVLRQPRILLEGWAARVRTLADGRRQILSFVVAGDVFGFHSMGRDPALMSMVALTQAVLAPLDLLVRLDSGASASSEVLAAARSMHRLEKSYLVNHVVRLGRQTAYERLGHLMLELYFRHRAVDLAGELGFPFPLTQETLSDALGLSVVHTNRTIQQLRRDGYLEFKTGLVTLHRIPQLAERVDFQLPSHDPIIVGPQADNDPARNAQAMEKKLLLGSLSDARPGGANIGQN